MAGFDRAKCVWMNPARGASPPRAEERERNLSRERTGFTLLEMIVVIATLLILAALLFPVYAMVQRRAGEARSISQMRQLGVALALYRNEVGADGSDAVAGAGLPPSLLSLYKWAQIPKAMWNTGGQPLAQDLPPVYTWLVPQPGEDHAVPSWAEYFSKDGDQAVPLLDETQGNERDGRFHPFTAHHILGLHLDGHVETKSGLGDYTNFWFWDPSLPDSNS